MAAEYMAGAGRDSGCCKVVWPVRGHRKKRRYCARYQPQKSPSELGARWLRCTSGGSGWGSKMAGEHELANYCEHPYDKYGQGRNTFCN